MPFIVDPIIYWLASTEGARIFISCILSWLGVSRLFDLSTWYLMKLYTNFNNDPIAKKEIDNAWQEAKKEAKGKT